MYFPVSGIDIFPLIPVAVGFCISFFCSMAGLSGAFLLLPFQMSFLGFTSPSVSPTNLVYNVVSTPGGVWRFIQERRMVWPLALVIIAGSVPGSLAGAAARILFLPDPEVFKCFVALVLLYISLLLIYGVLRKRFPRQSGASGARALSSSSVESPAQKNVSPSVPSGIPPGTSPGVSSGTPIPPPSYEAPFAVKVEEFSIKRISYAFMGETYAASTKGVFALCFIVGIVGGAYGIGGGAIIAPFLISSFRLPVHTVAGATLLGNFATSLSGLIFFQCFSYMFSGMPVAPDWGLGLLFGLGGLLGIYYGARAQKHVPELYIKAFICVVLMGTAAGYAAEAFV